MKAPLGFLPKARRKGIITKEVDGELLIYDRERDKAHCLNLTAALVWQLCDGRRGVTDLAQSVREALGTPVDEIVIELALKQLTGDHLLVEKYEFLTVAGDLSRRELVRRLGVAAVLLPLITTITAPTALAGISNCIPSGSACTEGGVPCCDAGTCTESFCM
jgi:hypothetical protein